MTAPAGQPGNAAPTVRAVVVGPTRHLVAAVDTAWAARPLVDAVTIVLHGPDRPDLTAVVLPPGTTLHHVPAAPDVLPPEGLLADAPVTDVVLRPGERLGYRSVSAARRELATVAGTPHALAVGGPGGRIEARVGPVAGVTAGSSAAAELPVLNDLHLRGAPVAATRPRVVRLVVPGPLRLQAPVSGTAAERLTSALPTSLRSSDALADALDGRDPAGAERLSELVESRELRALLEGVRGGRDVCWADEEDPEPLVTIRIPTYDRGPLIAERALASAARQTYERLEILVVGDACDEATERAVRAFPDPRVRFVNMSARGLYPEDAHARWLVAGTPAVNAAMDLARGAWIAPCDDDDELTDDHVEVLLAAARAQRLEMVWSIARMEHAPARWNTVGNGHFREGGISHGTVLFSSALRMFRYRGTCYRIDEPGDWNLWRRMAAAGVHMGFVDAVTYVHYLETPKRAQLAGKAS